MNSARRFETNASGCNVSKREVKEIEGNQKPKKENKKNSRINGQLKYKNDNLFDFQRYK